MYDYSSSLFYKEGEAPNFLPSRLRLPNRMTRYSTSVTLEEIESMGYFGPVAKPEHDHVNERVEWSTDLNSYLIVEKSSSEKAAEKNTEVRQKLQKELDKYSKYKNSEVYAPQYVDVWTSYLTRVSAALDSSELLTDEDVPVLGSLPPIIYANDLAAAQQEVIAEDAIGAEQPNTYDWKYWYEHVGVERWKPPWYPSIQPLDFEVPLDWVASGTAQ